MTKRVWDPNEWESYCGELMTLEYGVDVQLIPARDGGDGGLEAYVARKSIAFQCYAPDDPFSLKAQTDSQKNKIREDIKKLIDNPIRTLGLIGSGNVIEEWVLLTPSFESKSLVTYANDRSANVRENRDSYPWCGGGFRISVHDDSLFPRARAELQGVRTSRLTIFSKQVDLDSIREGEKFSGIEKIVDDKLLVDPRLASSGRLRKNYRDETLRDYFRGTAEMERLSREVPSVHRAITTSAEIIFDGLARSLAVAEGRPSVIVDQITESLRQVLSQRIPSLEANLCLLMARYFVACWWVQCPLQFDSEDSLES